MIEPRLTAFGHWVPREQLASAEQDIGRLPRKNARPREKNEILTKAAIYFAKLYKVKYAFIDTQRSKHCMRVLSKASRFRPDSGTGLHRTGKHFELRSPIDCLISCLIAP